MTLSTKYISEIHFGKELNPNLAYVYDFDVVKVKMYEIERFLTAELLMYVISATKNR